MRLTFSMLAAACLATGALVPVIAADSPDQVVRSALTMVRDTHHLPGVTALVQQNGHVAAEIAIGVRAQGHAEPVTTSDRWHIGSDTKAFTSTLIARLVEQGRMRFEDTLAQSLPALADRMTPAYRDITITQLLSHTSGLPALTDDKDLPMFLAALKVSTDLRAQRASVAATYLTQPPASKAGAFVYSNLGYIIAGAITEERTGKAWEDLVREQIFTPLGITNAGFGLPGTPGKVEQPQGHNATPAGFVPFDPGNPDGDNPLALGPAGTINMSLRDWMLFAQDHLDGERGHGRLLKAETYHRLHTPIAGPYALGWGVKPGPDGAPLLITHTGSNGYWIADVRIMPKKNLIVLFAANAGDEGANAAVQEFGKAVRDYFKPFD